MIEAAFTPYVRNIPWEEYEHQMFEEDIDKYISNIEHILGENAGRLDKIDFNDDLWDFSSYRPDLDPGTLRLHMHNCNACYKAFLKFFVLNRLAERFGIRSTIRNAKIVSSVLESILDRKRIKSISLITNEDIKNEIYLRNSSDNTSRQLFSMMACFYSFIEGNFRIQTMVETKELEALAKNHSARARNVDRKTPTIPEEYFKLIVDACLKAIHDETLPRNTRMTAGALLIESQTGIRSEDLLNLRLSDVKEKRYGDAVFHYLEFDTRKPSKSDTMFMHCKCRLNRICLEAIDAMEKLGEPIRRKSGTDYIYVMEDEFTSPPYVFPIKNGTFVAHYYRLMRDLLPDACERSWEGITPKKHLRHIYNIPTIKQFRVFVCTDLYRKGVSPTNIRRMMGHLSYSMAYYYVRQKETWQQTRAEAARQVICAVKEENAKPIGKDPGSTRMRDTIQKIAKDPEVNIAGSYEEILESIGRKLLVRAKPGGFCIRTGRTCAEDYKTDQTLCAYDECPNIYYFYFNLSTAYDDMKESERTYQHAIDSGHKREAEKEKYKIVNIARRRIIPMLDELERMLTTSTPEEIEERHPGMAETIRKKDEIRKEAMEWIAKSE